MRQKPPLSLALLLACTAVPAAAQDAAPAAPVEPERIILQNNEFGPAPAPQILRASPAATRTPTPTPATATCGQDTDLIPSAPSGPPRYDNDGQLIRPAPTCANGSVNVPASAPAAQDRLAVMREGECEESANGFSCANSGELGRGRFERETSCEETSNGRSCGGSVTWGTSSGTSERARNAAQDAIDRLRRD